MANINDTLAKLGGLADKYANLPLIDLDTYSFAKNIVPQIAEVKIDEKSTFAYQMQQQTNQIIEKSNEHIRLLNQHNEQLLNNYKKLEEMYSAQKESNEEAREDLRKSRVFNGWMMVIAIIAMLAAIAGPIATILVSR